MLFVHWDQFLLLLVAFEKLLQYHVCASPSVEVLLRLIVRLRYVENDFDDDDR